MSTLTVALLLALVISMTIHTMLAMFLWKLVKLYLNEQPRYKHDESYIFRKDTDVLEEGVLR